MSPSISVIMPAYNAERTIELALRSIRMQTIADQIEILVIDGGSTDATREIARQYGAVILENPHRLPEPAKLIGIQRAKGRYVVKQDTDEELIDPRQLERRIEFFSRHPQVRCIVCDEQRPDLNGGISTHYLCTYGDPFTFFVYRQKENILRTFKAAVSERDGNACVLRFAPGDLMPIGDGATTMFDLQWVKEHFADWNTQQFVCATSSRIFAETGCCGCITGDDVIHHTRATFSGSVAKLRFRVINNLYTSRKYLFVLYAATLVGPLVDSIRLALHHKDTTMLLHFVYVYYTCLCIAWYLLRALLGRPPENKTYGK